MAVDGHHLDNRIVGAFKNFLKKALSRDRGHKKKN